ncbi:MAG: cupin domain-containing protein [Negativicutes bacterium]|nr:cupin domain-containing protein [Negativicutes bacterium]
MITKASQLKTEVFEKRLGGKGEIKVTHILDNDQMQGKGRLFSRQLLTAGSSLGYHQHKGDVEAYYILSGTGTVDDNGTKVEVGPGDAVFTTAGESHSIENTGKTDLEFIALILFT